MDQRAPELVGREFGIKEKVEIIDLVSTFFLSFANLKNFLTPC